jgi:hypothetical protein
MRIADIYSASQTGLFAKFITMQIGLRKILLDGSTPLSLVEAFQLIPCLLLL